MTAKYSENISLTMPEVESQKGDLISFCIHGLESMYLNKDKRFSASFKLAGNKYINYRDRIFEYKYSMNALMGLAKARTAGFRVPFDLEESYIGLVKEVEQPHVGLESVAASLWTAQELGINVPAPVVKIFGEL